MMDVSPLSALVALVEMLIEVPISKLAVVAVILALMGFLVHGARLLPAKARSRRKIE